MTDLKVKSLRVCRAFSRKIIDYELSVFSRLIDKVIMS